MRGILASTPLYLIDFLFDFEGFQIVKLGFVRLEFGVKLVFTGFFLPEVSVFDKKEKKVGTAS